jgi:hypothetical protein
MFPLQRTGTHLVIFIMVRTNVDRKGKMRARKNYNLERREQVDKENRTSLGPVGNKVFENHNF